MGDKSPRICSVLGGEENPLKVGEEFDVDGDATGYHINENGVMTWGREIAEVWVLYDAINHPEKIIRRPQFSEDEKALMRLYVSAGYSTFVRGEVRGQDNQLMVSGKADYLLYLPEKVLPQITIQNSPFDAAAYLEREESK